MRNAFAEELLIQGKKNPRIILLTGDLGYSVFEQFQEELPNQYINCGVTEQMMTGMAAGLAIEGYIPVIYSIIPFITMRNFEQIRNDICYQNLPVIIVGVGAGFSYGPYGFSHHSLEDIGILRLLPNITITAPGDTVEARAITRSLLVNPRPSYLRLGKKGEPTFTKKTIMLGKGNILREGKNITIFVTSTMLGTAIQVADILCQNGISASVISMHTLVPFDEALLKSRVKDTQAIVTIEEHYIHGGLGTIVTEYLTSWSVNVRFLRIGVTAYQSNIVGNQEYVRAAHGLSAEKIIQRIKKDLLK